MPVEDLYPIVKRAYRRRISGLKPYEPKADESLFGTYGFGNPKKRAMFKPLNDEFQNSGHPLSPKLQGNETVEYDTVRGMSAHIFKTRFGSSFPVLFLCVFVALNSLLGLEATAALNLQDIDLDGNPEVVSFEERRAYFTSRITIQIGDFDKNQDGKIDTNELKELNDSIRATARNRLKDRFPGSNDLDEPTREAIALDDALDAIDEERIVPPELLTPREIEEQKREAEREKKRDFAIENDFYLRREGREVTTLNGRISPQEALISLRYDQENSIESGRITGALGFLRKATRKTDRPVKGPIKLTDYTYGGSVEIDRSFDSRGPQFEDDNLVFRLGGDLVFDHANGLNSHFTNWLRYDTSTKFESNLFGVESIYGIFIPQLSPTHKFDNGMVLSALFLPTLESDYSFTSEATAMDPFSSYWNLGAGARFEIALIDEGVVQASFSSDFEAFWNVQDNGARSINWVNQFNVPLARNDTTSLVIEHELAVDALRNSRAHEFSIGIGIKF